LPNTLRKILVRNYNSEDLADIKKILFEYRSPTYRVWDNNMIEAFISDALREQPDGVFVAEVDGKVAGFAVVIFRDWQNIAYLDYIQVETSEMKKGVGHNLIEKCINWSKMKRVRIVYTETGRNNVRAIEFYEKHGFQITGCIPAYYRKGLDAVILVRSLDNPKLKRRDLLEF